MEQKMLNYFRETGTGGGVGLMSMRERARELGGKVQIESSSTGTAIRVTIPIPPDCAGEYRQTLNSAVVESSCSRELGHASDDVVEEQ
jgi:hypothetical protein